MVKTIWPSMDLVLLTSAVIISPSQSSLCNISSLSSQRSDILWHFACGDVFLYRIEISRKPSMLRKSKGHCSSAGGSEREEILPGIPGASCPGTWKYHLLCETLPTSSSVRPPHKTLWWLNFTLNFPPSYSHCSAQLTFFTTQCTSQSTSQGSD